MKGRLIKTFENFYILSSLRGHGNNYKYFKMVMRSALENCNRHFQKRFPGPKGLSRSSKSLFQNLCPPLPLPPVPPHPEKMSNQNVPMTMQLYDMEGVILVGHNYPGRLEIHSTGLQPGAMFEWELGVLALRCH